MNAYSNFRNWLNGLRLYAYTKPVRKNLRKLARETTCSTEVARSLFELGVTGKPKRVESCPLANYAKFGTRPGTIVQIGAGYAGVMIFARGHKAIDTDWCLPSHLARFVREFDDGHYPALVDPN